MSGSDWSQREDRVRAGPVWREVALGVGIVVFEHFVVAGLLAGGGLLVDQSFKTSDMGLMVFFFWLFGIGLTQLGYILPTFLIAWFTRRNVAAGVALAALATFLLNGACFGVLCGSTF